MIFGSKNIINALRKRNKLMRKDGIYYTQNYEDKNFHYNQDVKMNDIGNRDNQ